MPIVPLRRLTVNNIHTRVLGVRLGHGPRPWCRAVLEISLSLKLPDGTHRHAKHTVTLPCFLQEPPT